MTLLSIAITFLLSASAIPVFGHDAMGIRGAREGDTKEEGSILAQSATVVSL